MQHYLLQIFKYWKFVLQNKFVSKKIIRVIEIGQPNIKPLFSSSSS